MDSGAGYHICSKKEVRLWTLVPVITYAALRQKIT